MIDDCEPVFVVGMNGSGTSMMLDSLGRHPALYALRDETHMMPYIISQAHRFEDLNDDENFKAYGRFAIEQIPKMERLTGGDRFELPADWLTRPRTIAGVFDGIFGHLAAGQGKRRWCEKTPDHVQHIEMLADVFPGSRFIHMIRDGREVACSINRRQKRQPELIVYRWKKLVEAGRTAGARLPDRYFEVRYEDLTADARKQMLAVCEFLQLEFSEQVLQSRMPQSPERKRLGQGELGEISNNPVKWPGYFDAVAVRRLEAIGGRRLAELGYDVTSEHGDRDPHPVQRHVWRAADFVRETNHLRKTTKRYDSWRKVARNTVLSFKEFRSKRY
ncbi:sulfotransferase [soil metagenome]